MDWNFVELVFTEAGESSVSFHFDRKKFLLCSITLLSFSISNNFVGKYNQLNTHSVQVIKIDAKLAKSFGLGCLYENRKEFMSLFGLCDDRKRNYSQSSRYDQTNYVILY